MNHETRIKALEKEIAELKSFIKELKKEKPKWLTIKEIEDNYQVSRRAIYNRIENGTFVHLQDWRKNGNRYLLNQSSIKKIL